MKKLNFIFKNAGSILYDCNVEYTLLDGVLCFNYENSIYKFKLGEKLEFKRTNRDSEFTLSNYDDTIKCQYLINELGAVVDVDVTDFEYKRDDGEYYIKYTLVSDEENEKTIILRLNPITY